VESAGIEREDTGADRPNTGECEDGEEPAFSVGPVEVEPATEITQADCDERTIEYERSLGNDAEITDSGPTEVIVWSHRCCKHDNRHELGGKYNEENTCTFPVI